MRCLSGYIGALVVVCIWGSTFVSSKVLLDVGLRPADIFLIRFVIAYLCMLAISHRRLFSDNWRDELVLFLLGIMGGCIAFVAEWGLYNLVTGRVVGSITGTLLNVIPFRNFALQVFVVYMAISVLVGVFGGVNAIRNYLKV